MTNTVVVGSAFRNATHYIQRYFAQVYQLQMSLWATGATIRVHAVEGDSTDDTTSELIRTADAFGIDLTVAHCSHGQPWFGSTEAPARMAALSKVGNAILDGVRESDDVLVYVESDLVWDGETMARLVRQQATSTYDSLSPLVMAGEAFYDIWGFRGLDGQRWSPFYPYHIDTQQRSPYVEVSSVGSCLVMASYVALDKRARMNDGALVEFCTNARKAGYRFAVNPSLRINHP